MFDTVDIEILHLARAVSIPASLVVDVACLVISVDDACVETLIDDFELTSGVVGNKRVVGLKVDCDVTVRIVAEFLVVVVERSLVAVRDLLVVDGVVDDLVGIVVVAAVDVCNVVADKVVGDCVVYVDGVRSYLHTYGYTDVHL